MKSTYKLFLKAILQASSRQTLTCWLASLVHRLEVIYEPLKILTPRHFASPYSDLQTLLLLKALSVCFLNGHAGPKLLFILLEENPRSKNLSNGNFPYMFLQRISQSSLSLRSIASSSILPVYWLLSKSSFNALSPTCSTIVSSSNVVVHVVLHELLQLRLDHTSSISLFLILASHKYLRWSNAQYTSTRNKPRPNSQNSEQPKAYLYYPNIWVQVFNTS